MDDLISLGETLQQASSALVGDDIPDEGARTESAPVLQLVVVGASGAGKSAVLNTLIGHAVLPTAEGGATRFPVLIDLQHDTNLPSGAVRGNLGARTNMPTASEIRRAVQSDMQKWTPSKNREEAHLVLRSSIAPPVRILDLPGVDSKSSDLDALLQDNTSNNDSIILVVLSAANPKDALKVLRIAHDIDREGARTVGVVTKLDAVANDKAAIKGAVELLQGQGPSMAQDYPWVAVIGQPVGDGDTNATLDAAWQAEAKSLGGIIRASGHKGLEGMLGRDALLKLLARTVRQKMKEKIPRILTGLEGRSQEVDSELLRLGESLISSLEGSRAVALELCRGFETKFCEHLDGSEGGGSQMVEKFVGVLPLRFRALPLDDLFSLDNVKRVVTEADGYQPYLLSPEKGLRLLIKRSLELAKQPGLDTVDEVHKILLDIVAAAGATAPSLVRFPPMKKELVSIASQALEQYRAEARTMVVALVDMERVFVPPAHFIEAEYARQERMWRDLEAMRKGLQEKGVIGRRPTDVDEKQPGRLAAAMSSMRRKEPPPPPPPVAQQQAAPTGPLQELAGFLWKVGSKGGWTKRWFALSDKTARLYYVKKPDEKTPRGVIPLEDCVIEDVVAPEECPPAPELKNSSLTANALSFKITNRVPYKAVVKLHTSLVLRADDMAQKNQWVQRMRMLTKAGREAPPPPPQQQQLPQSSSTSVAADGSAAADGGGSENATASDVPQDGQPDGMVANPVSMMRKPQDPDEELKYMAGEVKRYVRAVLAHLADSIPKAIVLTQVERTKDAMLTKLYQTVSALSDQNIAALLEEDVESKGKRERFRRLQESLVKLKRMLSLHEARASAEEQHNGEAPVDDWRKAFKAPPPAIAEEPSAPSPPPPAAERPPSPRASSSSSSSSKGGGGPARTSSGPSPQMLRHSASVNPSSTTIPPSGSSSTASAPSVARTPADVSPLGAGGPSMSMSMSMASRTSAGGMAPRQQSPMRGGMPMGMPNGPPGAAMGAPGTDTSPMGPPMGGRSRRVPPPPPATSVYKY